VLTGCVAALSAEKEESVMIERLTPAQIARFPDYVKWWTAVGLSTQPADRPRAEAAVRLMYECGGLPPPERIVWCGSPLSQGIARVIVLQNTSVRASVRASVRDSVRDSVRASVRDSVGASVRDSVRDSVGASVRDSVWGSVGASVRDSVGASVRDSVGASVRDSVWGSVGASVYGQHDANWLAWLWYFREQCGLVAETEPARGLVELAHSAGWALPHANICWVSERPCILRRDDRGRLHADGVPALEYPDGWAIHRWHGTTLPEWGQRPSSEWESMRLLTEQNAEVRRALIQGIGYERIARELGARTVHTDRDMELLRITADVDVEPVQLLKVVCPSTQHTHILRVPPETETCEQARHWTFWREDGGRVEFAVER
jgi:hypothetical protein